VGLPLRWGKDEILVRDGAFLEIVKTIFWYFHCFQKVRTIVYFKSLISSKSAHRALVYV
jgi:hypothetical protein